MHSRSRESFFEYVVQSLMLPSFIPIRVYKYLLGATLFFVVPSFTFAQAAGGATLSITPASGSYAVGKTFTVSVMVDSSAGFNSANATISFDPALLSATNVSKSSSAFSLWAVEPSSDNTKGTVSFEGGNTTPLTGKKTLLAVTFKALKEGKADVSFTAASVLAADGKGTDIVGAKNGASYDLSANVNDPTPPPPPPSPTAESGALPDAPEISSPSHANDTTYYNAAKAKFTWDLPPDVTVVRLSLDTKEKTIPTTNYDPAISEKEFDKLTDGVMYFHLRYKNDAGLGPTAHRKIMVDITPPEKFTLDAVTDASSTDVALNFSATDTPSGLDHYEIVVDDGNPIKATLGSVLGGTYSLTGQSPGDHKVKVTALDKAGNKTEAEASFKIAGELPSASAKTADSGEPVPTDWRLIGDIILIALIAFLIGYLWYERSAFRHEKYIAKREADELRDNLSSIFGALREEIGEQAGQLFQKPNPSAQDREVMVNLNEAIDLSEELLSKEIEDVRKLLM